MTALPIALMSEDEVAAFGRRETGFGALECERGRLPLAAMEVDARVVGVIASIDVAQTFVNTTGVAIEATYIFPLPDRAAVHRFRMEVAGRVVEGIVEERGAAREQYDEAIAAGHRAAITEQERSDVFTLRVGNLMPGEAATVRLSLVGPCAIDDGELTFRFPLVVAPRYIPGAALAGEQSGLGRAFDTELVPDASRLSPPVRLPGLPNPVRLALRVALADAGVREVASSLHAVTAAKRDAHVVEVQPGERLDRDFILRWRLDEAELVTSLACADDADGKGGTFMLTFVPPSSTTVAAKPRDVIFVIDRSGSMGGWKMVAARRAVARMIDTLTSRDRFQVIAFDNAVEMLPSASLEPGNDRTRFRAVELLAKIDARGGTDLEEPLRGAVQRLTGGTDDRERVVVLVTDGQVGNEDHILRAITPLKNVRVFTLGIDRAVNAGFLKRLAGAGAGLCELVESEDRLDAVMTKVHRRIGTPIATELALRGSGLAIDRDTIAPYRLPDVYAGAPVVVLGRYRGRAPANAAIELEGTSSGDPLKLSVARTGEGAPALAACWARAYIRDLEDRYATGALAVEPTIIEVSKRFGVLSRFTAYLAIDRSEVANKDGKVHQIVQPVEPPAGWQSAVGGAQAMHAYPMPARAVAMSPQFMPSPAAPPPPPGAPPPIRMQAPIGMPMPIGHAPHETYEGYEGAADLPLGGPGPEAPEDVGERLLRSRPAAAPAPASAADATVAYRAKLADVARELAAHASDATVLRRIRQRLAEWVEDLRSVGADDQLAAAVEHELGRLSAALALGGDLANEVRAVSSELAKLAAAGGVAPPPRTRAFWK